MTEKLKIYEAEESCTDYLLSFAEHLFHNKKDYEVNKRKFIGILLNVNDLDYFACFIIF